MRPAECSENRAGATHVHAARHNNDPEIMTEGYPPSTFDAEEAPGLVAEAFDDVGAQQWDERFFPLTTREEVRASADTTSSRWNGLRMPTSRSG